MSNQKLLRVLKSSKLVVLCLASLEAYSELHVGHTVSHLELSEASQIIELRFLIYLTT